MSDRYRLTLNGMFRDDDGDWVKQGEVLEFLNVEVEKLEADKGAWEACAQAHYEALFKANKRIAELEGVVELSRECARCGPYVAALEQK